VVHGHGPPRRLRLAAVVVLAALVTVATVVVVVVVVEILRRRCMARQSALDRFRIAPLNLLQEEILASCLLLCLLFLLRLFRLTPLLDELQRPGWPGQPFTRLLPAHFPIVVAVRFNEFGFRVAPPIFVLPLLRRQRLEEPTSHGEVHRRLDHDVIRGREGGSQGLVL
jgi:hypothetical protein